VSIQIFLRQLTKIAFSSRSTIVLLVIISAISVSDAFLKKLTHATFYEGLRVKLMSEYENDSRRVNCVINEFKIHDLGSKYVQWMYLNPVRWSEIHSDVNKFYSRCTITTTIRSVAEYVGYIAMVFIAVASISFCVLKGVKTVKKFTKKEDDLNIQFVNTLSEFV
jgi:hypothetical protein